VACLAQKGAKTVVVVNGQEGPEYDALLRGGRLVFDDARRLHALTVRGEDILRVEIEIVPAGQPRR